MRPTRNRKPSGGRSGRHGALHTHSPHSPRSTLPQGVRAAPCSLFHSGRFRPTDRAPTELYRKANGGPGRGGWNSMWVFWTSILNSLKGSRQNPKNKQNARILALRCGVLFWPELRAHCCGAAHHRHRLPPTEKHYSKVSTQNLDGRDVPDCRPCVPAATVKQQL